MFQHIMMAFQTVGGVNQGISDIGSGFRDFINVITDIQMFIYQGFDALFDGMSLLAGA